MKRWLIAAGIAAERLESKGFGQEQPVDTNETDQGRQNNRQVQFMILDKDEGAKSEDAR